MHTESYTVSWAAKTATKITLGVTPIAVPDPGGPIEDIIIKKDTQNAYPDRSGIEDPEDARAKINLRSGTFTTASQQLKAGSRVSYVSDKPLTVENLSSFSWVP